MNWHRLFGIALKDFFYNSIYDVDVEFDVSIQKQLLDALLIRKRPGVFTQILPDGVDPLAEYNLFTFKSLHDALSPFTLKELVAHGVAVQKWISPNLNDLLPDAQFRHYGVCARFPDQLHAVAPLQLVAPGVYDCQWAIDRVRVIVVSLLATEPRNALFQAFSYRREQALAACRWFQVRSDRTSRVLQQLLQRYRVEGWSMAYTMEQFMHDTQERLGIFDADTLQAGPLE
jgi:hypothetical protein